MITPYDVCLNKVQFAFGQQNMLFDAHILRESFTLITGPSGAGKSTLLNLIAGFITPSSGRIELMGRDVTSAPPSERPIAILFQDNNLFPHLNVEQNIALGIRPNLKLTVIEKTTLHDALSWVGLADKAKRLPVHLSGGEQQRVAIARILVQNKPIVLLDEPFASLGPSLRKEMIELLKTVQNKKKLTILAVTHHPNEWKNSADHFLFVNEGQIHAQGEMRDLNFAHESAIIRSYFSE
jgi:thiamine transport system ATP-binding protein